MTSNESIQVVPIQEVGIDPAEIEYFIAELARSNNIPVFDRAIAEAEDGSHQLLDTPYDYCLPGWLDNRSTSIAIPPSLSAFTNPLNEVYPEGINHYALVLRHAAGDNPSPAPNSAQGTEGLHTVVPLLGTVRLAIHGTTYPIEEGELAMFQVKHAEDVPEFSAPRHAGYLALSLEAR